MTACLTHAALPMILAVLLYVALIVCVPFGNALVVMLAFPPQLSNAVPSVVVPVVNVTLPVDLVEGLLTSAVKVIGWPARDGLTDDMMVVLEGAELTVWMAAFDVLLMHSELPLYRK